MRDRLPDHWVEMLGPEAEQVNESERVDRRPKFQLAKYFATVDHFPPEALHRRTATTGLHAGSPTLSLSVLVSETPQGDSTAIAA